MKKTKMTEEYLKGLGHRLKIIRAVLNFDQKRMSKLMETAQSQISKIEAGQSAPTLHQLLKIKSIAEENVYLREALSWEWLLEGKGKGILG